MGYIWIKTNQKRMYLFQSICDAMEIPHIGEYVYFLYKRRPSRFPFWWRCKCDGGGKNDADWQITRATQRPDGTTCCVGTTTPSTFIQTPRS